MMKKIKLQIKTRSTEGNESIDSNGVIIPTFTYYHVVYLKKLFKWKEIRRYLHLNDAKEYVKNYPESEKESPLFREVFLKEDVIHRDSNESGRLSLIKDVK